MPSPINPSELAPPRGYSNGLRYEPGRTLFIAGQIGWDRECKLAEGFIAQFDLAMANMMAVLKEAGGEAAHLGRMTIYVTDKKLYTADLKAVGQVYRSHMGKHFPAMSLVEVQALLEDQALVEIEGTAILPPASPPESHDR